MNEIEGLLRAYEKFVRLPWDMSLAGPQKVWFALYDPMQERRLRLRIEEFAIATQRAGHPWLMVDLTDTFAHWMAAHEYRESYFEQPEDIEPALEGFVEVVVAQLRQALAAPDVDNNTVVAVVGVASLFGLAHASQVLNEVTQFIHGRLLVFFPGQRDGSIYRLLDARDGWNYLAVPITATEER